MPKGVLLAGDELISLTIGQETSEITRQYHIIDSMLDMRPGDVVTLNVLRDGEEISLDITITEECLTAYSNKKDESRRRAKLAVKLNLAITVS